MLKSLLKTAYVLWYFFCFIPACIKALVVNALLDNDLAIVGIILGSAIPTTLLHYLMWRKRELPSLPV